ncbi:AI-2E family transporter [Nocardioides sp. AE5]|uniref:AI-2E family transporter n=1 Tax=Nocardioides sp. AE5 TaxID=2962573 RepID=UPI0028811A55|nr:AI-2E family transporter [Nocardioides sp. AE5]MDT0200444.1 AI-2E family transporter [Nocardioides sp. AE5]
MSTPDQGRSRAAVIGDGIEWTARWSIRWVCIALGALLVGIVISWTWTIILPVALALIITTVLAPIAQALERWLRFPPAAAAGGALIGSMGVVAFVIYLLAPSIGGQTEKIVNDTMGGLARLQEWVQESDVISKPQLDAALQGIQDRLKESSGDIANGVLVGVGAVTSAVITLVVTLILTFLFLKDGRRFIPWVRDLAGDRVGGHLAEVLSRSWATLGGFIRTQALVSFIDAVFIGIGLVLVGVPLAIPLAVLTFFGGFVPIVGAFVVGAIAVLVALVSVGWNGALIVLAIIVAVQQLEGNVLSPWLQSKSMNLHAGVVLLSVALGSTLFGIIGAFLAVPTVAVAAVVLRYLNEQAALAEGTPHPIQRVMVQTEEGRPLEIDDDDDDDEDEERGPDPVTVDGADASTGESNQA